jgi:hypothetical protein
MPRRDWIIQRQNYFKINDCKIMRNINICQKSETCDTYGNLLSCDEYIIPIRMFLRGKFIILKNRCTNTEVQRCTLDKFRRYMFFLLEQHINNEESSEEIFSYLPQ